MPSDASRARRTSLSTTPGLRRRLGRPRSWPRLHPHRIRSSDLSRARATADALAGITGLAVTDDVDLRETYAGEWQGLTRTELEERFGADLQQWAAGAEIRPGGRWRRAARWLLAWWLQWTATWRTWPPGETLVVATHGGAARAAIGSLLGLPIEHWAALGVLANCAWSVLEENTSAHGPRWRLQEYNAGSLP